MTSQVGRMNASDQHDTEAVLRLEHAQAERQMNTVRAGVLALLATIGGLYSVRLPAELTRVHLAVLIPLAVWTIAQHVLVHRKAEYKPWLSTLNATVDVSAVTALLLGYGLVGRPEFAIHSPMWVAYLIILGARPFTTAAKHAFIASTAAVLQYGALDVLFLATDLVDVHAGDLSGQSLGGMSLLDEALKLLMLGAAGWVGTYATARTERTLRRVREALRASEAELAHQAFHDPLTGLANRALFRDRVEHALERARRQPERIAVLFLDLDDFKIVNDSLGHRAGDRLLESVASRLLNATRGCDTVARLGGDEFAVLLENVREDWDAAVVAERIVAALRAPVHVEGRSVKVQASVGIAKASDAAGAEELLRNADVAMYAAKTGGRARWEFFAPEMHAAIVERLALQAELHQALDRGEFRLLYQPIVELDGGKLLGVEALLRWAHPTRGLLSPEVFIPTTEATGLIIPLGRWVLREACRQCAAWPESVTGGESVHVAVNVSAKQLQHEPFVQEVAEALRDTGLLPARLVLEITESALMDDTEATLKKLREIKALGVGLALDDFGTGYSSLTWLRRMPADIVKIDKGFVNGLPRDGNDTALIRAILNLGGALSLRTIAEGVETEEQLRLLRELGCEVAQGYLFAPPLAAEAVRQEHPDYARHP
jgi:diguanylate cyclase (GGDEF)-like protein